ncbi:MFS family permease [Salirhabdus euzebyi]|uniref:MFS family permease n=1 Tax=Salirhabdus euzebyi TaxID=394506 RepID=A0A841Q5P7_9BACI|nr:MFS transporter [Salirhabdus euzebyi]MBB6453718.1 MFS family permease [Salirhabdus euzebyi]
MSLRKRSINLKLIVPLFFVTGVMGARPLIPLIADELNADHFDIGLLVSVFSLFPFLIAIKVGQVMDKIGYKNPIILSGVIGIGSLLVPFFFPNMVGLYISQILAGSVYTVFIMGAQTYGGTDSSEQEKDHNIVMISVGVSIGSFIGPLLSGVFAEVWGYRISFALMGLAILPSLFIASNIKDKKQEINYYKRTAKFINSLTLLKEVDIRKVILISMIVLAGRDIFTAYIPLIGISNGLSNSMIGFIVSINAFAGIIVRWSMPYLILKFGRNNITLCAILGSGALFLLIPIASSSISLILVSFILGMGLGLGQPLSISTMVHILPQKRIGEGLGLRLSASRFAQLSSPVLFGFVAQIFSMSFAFFFAGTLILFSGAKTKINDNCPTTLVLKKGNN